jgi:PAS domain-containing protein
MEETGRKKYSIDLNFSNTDVEMITKSRTPVTMDFNLQTVKVGGKDMIFAVGRDITDRIKRETALASSREQLKMALDTAGKSVWEWDLTSGKITITCQIPSLLGYNSVNDTMCVDDLSSVLCEEGIERLKTSIKRHLRGDSPAVDEEFHAFHADGSRRWIQVEGKTVGDFLKAGADHILLKPLDLEKINSVLTR